MRIYPFFDGVLSRWIDEWEPEGNISVTHCQSIRCYTLADLLLPLECTELKNNHADFSGEPFDPLPTEVSTNNLMHNFKKGYTYTFVLTLDD